MLKPLFSLLAMLSAVATSTLASAEPPPVSVMNLDSVEQGRELGISLAAEANQPDNRRTIVLLHIDHEGRELPQSAKWVLMQLDSAGVNYQIRRISIEELENESRALVQEFTNERDLSQLEQVLERTRELARGGMPMTIALQAALPEEWRERSPGTRSQSHREALQAFVESPQGALLLQANQTTGVRAWATKLQGLSVRRFLGMTGPLSYWIKVPRTPEVRRSDLRMATSNIMPTALGMVATLYTRYALENPGAPIAQGLLESAGSPSAIATNVALNVWVWLNSYWFRSIKATLNQGTDVIEPSPGVFQIRANPYFSWAGTFLRGMMTNVILASASNLIWPWELYGHLGSSGVGGLVWNAFVGTFARIQIDKSIADRTPRPGQDGQVVVRPGQWSEHTAARVFFWWNIAYGYLKNVSLLGNSGVADAIYWSLAGLNVAWSLDEQFNHSRGEAFVGRQFERVNRQYNRMRDLMSRTYQRIKNRFACETQMLPASSGSSSESEEIELTDEDIEYIDESA